MFYKNYRYTQIIGILIYMQYSFQTYFIYNKTQIYSSYSEQIKLLLGNMYSVGGMYCILKILSAKIILVHSKCELKWTIATCKVISLYNYQSLFKLSSLFLALRGNMFLFSIRYRHYRTNYYYSMFFFISTKVFVHLANLKLLYRGLQYLKIFV